ncbi:hypothetical protein BZG36_04001 [Bifiguratus adelaidae]|uniref:Efficient mitochondria targeting-associated protein 19 n=1 Tax=Bifiguratus adelaidae TaxID=1938954 RepID=A0A261XYK8_9FUNG|nr:hypothetical protein BZG36_04001 [Bifiguratus adelaidae]
MGLPITPSIKARPFSERSLDILYFSYILTHIPATIILDIPHILPEHLVPSGVQLFRQWYVSNYKDPFIGGGAGIWFSSFIVCEALFQLPFFVWSLSQLWNDSKRVRPAMVVYSTHAITTLVPIIGELTFNRRGVFALTQSERTLLFAFYLPYLLIPLVMLIDSYRQVLRSESVDKDKKLE